MGCGRRRNPLLRRGQKWRDPALAEIDRQEHQLLRRRAFSAGDAKHLVRQVQALAIGPDDLADDAEPLANQHFTLVEIVGLADKSSMICPALVVPADPDRIKQQVGGTIEQHGVVGEVHMTVQINPFGQNFALVTIERRRDAHRLDLPWTRCRGGSGAAHACKAA